MITGWPCCAAVKKDGSAGWLGMRQYSRTVFGSSGAPATASQPIGVLPAAATSAWAWVITAV
jgi:hypothetical protein